MIVDAHSHAWEYPRHADRTSVYIASGEQESGTTAFQRLLDERYLDIIQPDLARFGGLTEGKKIAYMACDRYKKLVPCAFKTGILVAASSHFAASIPNDFMIEYTVSTSPLAQDLVRNPVEFKDGCVSVPADRPGLGVEIDEPILEKYRVR